jgi:hypothetical protein
MARRPGERRVSLSPPARRLAGWLAALGLVAAIAIGVRLVGGTGEGSPDAAATPTAGVGSTITFGTALDPVDRLVPAAARTSRFAPGDTFAYAAADVPSQPTVWVDVERVTADGAEIVQDRAEQRLPETAPAIAFEVPAGVLHDAFGPGEYRMRIYLDADDEYAAAEGTFVLEGSVTSPAPSG